MYYRVRFEILGRSPDEEAVTEVFQGEKKIIAARAEIKETTKIKSEVPQDIVDDSEGPSPNLNDINYGGSVEPGWGQLFFETPEEYEPETIVEMFEETAGKIDAPLTLLYIDANTEAFTEE